MTYCCFILMTQKSRALNTKRNIRPLPLKLCMKMLEPVHALWPGVMSQSQVASQTLACNHTNTSHGAQERKWGHLGIIHPTCPKTPPKLCITVAGWDILTGFKNKREALPLRTWL